jgi:hypothetical protein
MVVWFCVGVVVVVVVIVVGDVLGSCCVGKRGESGLRYCVLSFRGSLIEAGQ